MPKAKLIFTSEMDELLTQLYPVTKNKRIAELTGWDPEALGRRSVKLGLKKTRECKSDQPNRIVWTTEMISYLQENFTRQTNRELAAALQVKITVLRNKTRELGLKVFELQPWTAEQVAFLIAHYQVAGDVDLAEMLQQRWPRDKAWTKKNVNKKRQLMGLHRTPEQISAIVSKHVKPGGRSYSIDRNSSSINLQDRYVASLIAWRDRMLKTEILKRPELIELKRKEIQLARAIKKVSNGT